MLFLPFFTGHLHASFAVNLVAGGLHWNPFHGTGCQVTGSLGHRVKVYLVWQKQMEMQDRITSRQPISSTQKWTGISHIPESWMQTSGMS